MSSITEEMDKSLRLYRKLLRTARGLKKELSGLLVEDGLTGSQYAVLEAIPESGITLSAVAKLVGKDPSNITGIVDRLERSGWIERRLDVSDRRIIRIFITPKGKMLLQKIESVHPVNVHQRLRILTDEEKTQMMKLLDKMEENRGDVK